MKYLVMVLPILLTVMLRMTFSVAGDIPSYVVMNKDLAEIKTDFNNAVDQVRLVFIVGPT